MFAKLFYQAAEDILVFLEASEGKTSWWGYSVVMAIFIYSLEASW